MLDFGQWALAYAAAGDDAKSQMVGEGVRMASRRKQVMLNLIKTDPRQALEAHHKLAPPPQVRAALPQQVQQHMEEPVDAVGDLHVLIADDFGDQGELVRSELIQHVFVNSRQYNAHLYGRRSQIGSKEGIALHAISLEGEMAVYDSPVRRLSPGEPGYTDDGVAVMFRGKVRVFDDAEQAERFEQAMIAAETTVGPEITYPEQ